jgi:hypothetical protein
MSPDRWREIATELPCFEAVAELIAVSPRPGTNVEDVGVHSAN